MNIDDFLKEGGINIEDLDEYGERINKNKDDDEEVKNDSLNIEADEKMCGYLVKSSV